ncbi:uracil-DNA glycosylase family protein [Candidatus Nitrotoga sp. M5]|uniref:uracil-DNA glycosylase family protein n=1 Tax=Candidatus Nitrotoga sp. M5 TaxID=2890409 RepID=UPI001EF3C28C|nr:uracil-DNA glycosylase family protein [Candidatus Nitrotoga sp. M5]CAH1385139.1 putative uracil-DNA glycosylase family protein [Candidatus Nitrotoga sp. M5]
MLKIESLLNDIRECTICEKHLAYGARPILQINPNAKILIAGQAPGKKVHESGVPFDDASGDRLRDWMGVSKNTFYDSNQIAILPMGFCYPGKGKNGDLPPRPECERAWRDQLLAQLPNIKTMLVLGKYAQAYHFGSSSSSLTALVKSWPTYWPSKVPLPHPSPRNNIWLSKNRWFEQDLIPLLQKQCRQLLQDKMG